MTRILLSSATYILPDASAQTPVGKLNSADVPIPFNEPGEPEPANVATEAVAVFIFLILLLPPSAIYKLPDWSIQIPQGFVNRAEFPVASTKPGVPVAEPAKTETIPVLDIFLILFPL